MATITAILVVKLFSNLSLGFQGIVAAMLRAWKFWLTLLLIGLVLLIANQTGALAALGSLLPPHFFSKIISFISIWAIPFLLLVIPLLAIFKKIKVYEVFVEGAKEGFQVAVRIIPFLVAILVVIGMFRASGAMEFFVGLLTPVTNLIGMPAEILPAALMRPLSGSGTLGIITELLETHGPDSFIGNLASTIYGCTETTFYVIAVYFGAVGIKNTRFAIPAGLIADAVGVLAAVYICRLVFL